jgi:hypothetical protein
MCVENSHHTDNKKCTLNVVHLIHIEISLCVQLNLVIQGLQTQMDKQFVRCVVFLKRIWL